MITCATDWIGMSEDDVGPSAIPALLDLSNFTPLPDRLQQGFLDFIYLGRLLAHPDGLADDPAFKFGGDSVLATDKGLFYYGNSQGGIAGGALTAVEPDITRSVLYVPGMNYSTLLTRSVDFEDYALILYPSYPDEGSRPLLLTLIQSMWDRGEPDGYANHMTTDPLPNTPAAQGADPDGLRRSPGRQRRDRGRGADDRGAAAPPGARRQPDPGRLRADRFNSLLRDGHPRRPRAAGGRRQRHVRLGHRSAAARTRSTRARSSGPARRR